MKRTPALLGWLLCTGALSAQTYQLKVLSTEWTCQQDSTVLKMELSLSTDDLKSFDHIHITPILTSGNQRIPLSTLVLNSKQAQKKSAREHLLARRKGNAPAPAAYSLLWASPQQTFSYRGAAAGIFRQTGTKLDIQKEVFQRNGNRTQNELLTVGVSPAGPTAALPVAPVGPAVGQEPARTQARPATVSYKGSYLSPESDVTDERNQKELNFSLDEAKVIAEITPQMLSLRELYAVALSYKSQPDKFYHIIQTSVQIYPAHPVANLNAAAAALEQGNVDAAGRYLQVASHETLAYKSCRGIYELLCNNLYEGIRLLKAAKAEGSEEAAINLKLFFDSNKTSEIPQ